MELEKPTPISPIDAIAQLRKTAEARGVQSMHNMLRMATQPIRKTQSELAQYAVHTVVDGSEFRLLLSYVGDSRPMSLLSIGKIVLDVCVPANGGENNAVLKALGILQRPAEAFQSPLARSTQFLWVEKI